MHYIELVIFSNIGHLIYFNLIWYIFPTIDIRLYAVNIHHIPLTNVKAVLL